MNTANNNDKHTFINNKLGIRYSSTFINNNSDITINNNELIIKDVINENIYTVLYLEKSN